MAVGTCIHSVNSAELFLPMLANVQGHRCSHNAVGHQLRQTSKSLAYVYPRATSSPGSTAAAAAVTAAASASTAVVNCASQVRLIVV